jgi:hypothetical protein
MVDAFVTSRQAQVDVVVLDLLALLVRHSLASGLKWFQTEAIQCKAQVL